MKIRPIFSFPLALLFGCSDPMSSPGSGSQGPFKTSADRTLQKDIQSNITMFHKAKFQNCNELKFIGANVWEVKGTQENHNIVEEWTVTGCGRTFAYKVRLISDPKGGTTIGIEIGPNNPKEIVQNKSFNGVNYIANLAAYKIPKDRKDFNLFYYPPKSDPNEVISKLVNILNNSKPNGLFLVIGSDDPSMQKQIAKNIFFKFTPNLLKGAKIVMVALNTDQAEIESIIKGTGADFDFVEFKEPKWF